MSDNARPFPHRLAPASTAASHTDWAFVWRMADARCAVVLANSCFGALLLGVAAIGTVGSVADAMRSGIATMHGAGGDRTE